MKRNPVENGTNIFLLSQWEVSWVVIGFFTPLIKVLYKHIAYDGFWSLTPNYIKLTIAFYKQTEDFHVLLQAILSFWSYCQLQHFRYNQLSWFKKKYAKSRCKPVLITSNQPFQSSFSYQHMQKCGVANTVRDHLVPYIGLCKNKNHFCSTGPDWDCVGTILKGFNMGKTPSCLHRHNSMTELESIILLPIPYLGPAEVLKLETPWCW